MLLSLSLGDKTGVSSIPSLGVIYFLFVIVIMLRASLCCFVPSRGLSSCLCIFEGKRKRSRKYYIGRNKGDRNRRIRGVKPRIGDIPE
jgi:hypothetical protein